MAQKLFLTGPGSFRRAERRDDGWFGSKWSLGRM